MSALKSLGEYDFPSRDRKELYGDDQLVSVVWDGNIFVGCAGLFRAPSAMTWADFKSQMIDPWAQADPDYRASGATDWRLDDTPFEPKPDLTLADLGIVHKGLVRFRVV